MTDMINNRIFFFKPEDVILKIFTRILILAYGHGYYEKIK